MITFALPVPTGTCSHAPGSEARGFVNDGARRLGTRSEPCPLVGLCLGGGVLATSGAVRHRLRLWHAHPSGSRRATARGGGAGRCRAVAAHALAGATVAVVDKTEPEDAAAASSAASLDAPWLLRHVVSLRQEGRATGEQLAARFFGATAERGIELYPKQEEAIREVFGDSHVALSTPTGSGKSLVAVAMLFRAVVESGRAYYTCPIKALVSEKFFELCKAFGPELVGMCTGDVTINSRAPIICCTAEVLANVALRDGPAARVDFVVMDEFHYFSDKERGYAWEVPLLRLLRTRFLLMSATMGFNEALYNAVERISGRLVKVVTSKDRPVPLDWSYMERNIYDGIAELIQDGKVPAYIVNFTQREAADVATTLTDTKRFRCTDEKRKELECLIRDFNFDTPYGSHIRKLLLNGIGLHHAGLLPKYRLLVERLAQAGKLTCICGTDTLGVGVNVPIRTVLFTKLCKFDGEETVILPARDFHQIAGRAGRRGFDTQGSVVAVPPLHVVENIRVKAKMQNEKKKKDKEKFRSLMMDEPNKNYKKWDVRTFEKLQQSDPEPLTSQFQLSQGAVLALLQGAQVHHRDGGAELRDFVASAQCPEDRKEFWAEQALSYTKALMDTGLVSQNDAGAYEVSEALQEDFILLQDVSLFVVDVLPLIQWSCGTDASTYATAILSIAEAVCEGPKPILKALSSIQFFRNLNKSRKQGKSYDEGRQEASQEEYRKPLPGGQDLLDAYDSFLKRHPWVDRGALQPKAIALEMWEAQFTFSEYITRLSKKDKFKAAERQEGLLLRYLMQVHKTLRHNVPEEFKTDEVLEIEAFLLDAISSTDSSLLKEWEALKLLEAQGAKPSSDVAEEGTVGGDTSETKASAAWKIILQAEEAAKGDGVLGISIEEASRPEPDREEAAVGERPETDLELRSLRSRVRVEARRLARQLARGDFRGALRGLWVARRGGGEEGEWDVESLKAAAASRRVKHDGSGRGVQVVELEELDDGFGAVVEFYATAEARGGGDDFDDEDSGTGEQEFGEVVFSLEVSARWPANPFEPLLELISFA
mmetsp:Transcript_150922/g.485017  ORF Transcript_150922/g.485017 Transcript_150922/m.485017 type:complete len:1052 (+) Transcript_150922:144-3299(+)